LRITKQWLEKKNFKDQQELFKTLDVIYQNDKKKKLKNSVLLNYDPSKPLKKEIVPTYLKAEAKVAKNKTNSVLKKDNKYNAILEFI
jgi:hypothetical protein